MDLDLLHKVFGRDQAWHGPCTLIVDCEAAVATLGIDTLLGGGAKQYAPRMVSGRIPADSVCLLKDGRALVFLQQHRIRQPSGEEIIRQTLTLADPAHVVALEFADTNALGVLGLSMPVGRLSGIRSRSSEGQS